MGGIEKVTFSFQGLTPFLVGFIMVLE